MGSYPTVATARSVNDKLAWISARGLGVGPNLHGPNPNSPNDSDDFINSFQYLPSIVRGSSGILRFPSDKKIRNLTPKADRQIHPVNQQSAPSNTPIRANGPIKHVFFIVKENRTYDQVLGDDPRGDGDRHLTLFGKRITPNTHALVRRFPLLDHVYANSEASIDGHYWTAAGAVSDYVTKNWPQNYSGRGRPYDFGAYEVSAPPKGYIFQRALAENIPFFNYGEALAGLSPFPDKDRTAAETATNAQVLKNSDVGLNGCYDGDIAIFNPVGVSNVDVYDSSVPAGAPPTSHSRFTCFKTRFQSQLLTNSVPALNYMSLPLDHTQGVSPGKRTPNADVADNDWGLGQIVQEISHSKIWKSSLILVMEDDSQDGADHVDAHRIPAMVISPYTQRGVVVHDRYDQLSFLRTTEKIIGMKPLNLAEHLAVPLYDAMTPKPRNAAPYNAIRPKVSVTATNPNTAANRRASKGLPLNALDQVPQQRLDGILWRYKHGPHSTPPPPGPNASAQDTESRDQSGDEALGHPGRDRPEAAQRVPPLGRRRELGRRPAGRDVQPHVVQGQRARGILEHRVQVRLVKVLRQPVQVPAAAHGPQKLARLARLLDSLLEPAPHPIEPGALEAHIGVAGRGEVPATGDAAEVGREALVAVDVLERVQELVEIADPAALRLHHAARPQRRIQALEQPLGGRGSSGRSRWRRSRRPARRARARAGRRRARPGRRVGEVLGAPARSSTREASTPITRPSGRRSRSAG